MQARMPKGLKAHVRPQRVPFRPHAQSYDAAPPSTSSSVTPSTNGTAHAVPDSTPSFSPAPWKLSLLSQVAGLNRGALAKPQQHAAIAATAQELESNYTGAAFSGSPAPVDGRWELVYSSVETFRSSPFFWAFQEGLVQDRDLSAQIFKFTDSIPGATVGPAYQEISVAEGKLISEVDLTVCPGLTGTVVTRSEIEPVGDKWVEVTVNSTSVEGSNVGGFLLDGLAVPVRELVEQVRGVGATRVNYEVTYVDEDMRISRTFPDQQLFVYRRV